MGEGIVREQSELDLPRDLEVALQLGPLAGILLEARVLERDGGDAGERPEEVQIALAVEAGSAGVIGIAPRTRDCADSGAQIAARMLLCTMLWARLSASSAAASSMIAAVPESSTFWMMCWLQAPEISWCSASGRTRRGLSLPSWSMRVMAARLTGRIWKRWFMMRASTSSTASAPVRLLPASIRSARRSFSRDLYAVARESRRILPDSVAVRDPDPDVVTVRSTAADSVTASGTIPVWPSRRITRMRAGPTCISLPLPSVATEICLPPIHTPFAEFRSWTSTPCVVPTTRQCFRETDRSGTMMSAVGS
jgi:hypothetical protein